MTGKTFAAKNETMAAHAKVAKAQYKRTSMTCLEFPQEFRDVFH
jgi:hypothetical protein